MVIFTLHALESVLSEGEKGYPQECCGLLAGEKVAESYRVQTVVPMKNRVASVVIDRYLIDPAERGLGEEKISRDGMELIGFYHSHPDHDAYFSQTDLENSEEYQFGTPWLPPTYAYLVLSVKNGKVARPLRTADFAAFIIKEGKAEKIPVQW